MNEIGRKITDKLIEIHGGTGFKIAFLPYKRSMWNSMQSVYEECKASGIEVHCMPIPYYRMKENKQIDCIDSDFDLFGQIAERIEDLEDIHPDYIAIHYQYQDHNKVTNMLPEYFTKALKDRYDAKIIYLPYGLYGGKGWFSLQPGCRDIDYGFLEDDNAAEMFIAGWKTQGIDFTGRVFGFGSPKLDAMGKLTKEIPDEWADMIRGRSVTLLCNSLSAFLTNHDAAIDRYESTVIRELYDGHAVIFRPHPLLRQTIRSMRPDAEARYDLFLEKLRLNDVIIDESEYLERALGIADRLISDPSSVAGMWMQTSKPCEVLG